MARHPWDPICERPRDLVTPVRVDPAGLLGPTKAQAAGPHWRRTSPGYYVPAAADDGRVEQRILEQGTRLRSYGAVTGWASLRWRQARFFEGATYPEGTPLPVPLVLGNNAFLQPDPRVEISRGQLAPRERERIEGLWCTTPSRALLDEIRRHGRLRQGVVDVEMAVAARLVTFDEFATYVASRNAWTGVPLARDVVALVGMGCRSPQEARMVLVWRCDAGLPTPLCNVPVFDLRGNLLGVPDLLDVEAGVVGEYQGADHKDGERHRSDVARDYLFRDAGLEYFEVVGGDMADRALVVRRMLAARRRAKFLAPGQRAWTLEPPDWWHLAAPEWLVA